MAKIQGPSDCSPGVRPTLWTAFIVESDAAGPYPVLLFASPKHIAGAQGPRIDLIPSAQGIAIHADAEVPFDLIAELHERIGLWADSINVDAPLWIVLE